MSRSKWKGPYIDSKFIKSFEISQIKKKNLPLIISRNSTIVPKFIGLTFKVHTGKTFLDVTVMKEMLGHKFGEFIPTRAKYSFKKKKKKKR